MTLVQDSNSPPREVFRPNSTAQVRFFLSDAPELLFSSAYGKGKTRVICEKANWLCCSYPGAEVVLARKQRAHMGATTLRTLLDEVVHPYYVGRGWRPTADGGSTLFYENGSKLLVVGLDNPGRARSGSFTAAYVDQAEELEEDEWNAIGGRLRHQVGPYRQLGAACNPESPDHFLFRKFRPDLGTHQVRSQEDEVLPDGRVIPKGNLITECITSGTIDNYANLPVDYLLRLSRLKGRYKSRYVIGLWVAFEGMVYDCWDPNLNLIERPTAWEKWGGYPPPDWPRYRSVDFGYRSPSVILWSARDPEGGWWIYREIYMSTRLTSQHARHALELEDKELHALRVGIEMENERRSAEDLPLLEVPDSLPISASVCDHDAEDAATLQSEGFWVNNAEKDVSPGIQCVYEAMLPTETSDGRVSTQLHVLRDSLVEVDSAMEASGYPTCLADEIPQYRYERTRGSDKPVKESPRKLHDHACVAAFTMVDVHRKSGPDGPGFIGGCRIDQVRAGDQVLTPTGWRPVFAAACTAERAEVVEVIWRTGKLYATPDHPILAFRKSWSGKESYGGRWVPAGELRTDSMVKNRLFWTAIRQRPRVRGSCAVWNLEVEGGAFFANGIVVHNCDALRMMLYSAKIHGEARIIWL